MDIPIRVKAIVEMLGSPKEHVHKTLADYVDALNKNKRHTVNSFDIAEPEKRNELWTAFVEIDMTFPNADALVGFCFESMPSSIDIIEPENVSFEAGVLTGLLNDLQARLHSVDMSLKTLTAEKTMVDRNAMFVLHNFVRHCIKEGTDTAEKLSPIVGLPPERITPFLSEMTEKRMLIKKGDSYSIP
jgi:hypothetical protein